MLMLAGDEDDCVIAASPGCTKSDRHGPVIVPRRRLTHLVCFGDKPKCSSNPSLPLL